MSRAAIVRQYLEAAHELTHEWEVELAGFDQRYADRAWSYANARRFALSTIRRAPQFSLWEVPGSCDRLRPLQTVVGGAAAYDMSMFAVDALAQPAGPAAEGTYFRNLASRSAEQAFQAAFHEPMDEFLTVFDAQLAQEQGR